MAQPVSASLHGSGWAKHGTLDEIYQVVSKLPRLAKWSKQFVQEPGPFFAIEGETKWGDGTVFYYHGNFSASLQEVKQYFSKVSKWAAPAKVRKAKLLATYFGRDIIATAKPNSVYVHLGLTLREMPTILPTEQDLKRRLKYFDAIIQQLFPEEDFVWDATRRLPLPPVLAARDVGGINIGPLASEDSTARDKISLKRIRVEYDSEGSYRTLDMREVSSGGNIIIGQQMSGLPSVVLKRLLFEKANF